MNILRTVVWFHAALLLGALLLVAALPWMAAMAVDRWLGRDR